MEIWKKIVGFETYSISSEGRIRNDKRNKSKIATLNKYGYYSSSFSGKNFLIHRLVAQAFISNPDNKLIVNHIDGNKINNKVENLEWVSSSENSKHAFNNGLKANTNGEKNIMSKLSEKDIIEIFYAEGSHQKIANHYNIGRVQVTRVKNKTRWKELLDNLDKIYFDFIYLKEKDLVDNRTEKTYDELLPYERKIIDEYPNYTIDIKGNIYNLISKKYLLFSNKDNSYPRIILRNKISKSYALHILLAKHFIPNPENKPIVNHINADKNDYRLENLEWTTYSENTKHAIKIGNLKPLFGEKNHTSKLKEKDVIDIFKSETFYKDLAKQYDISESQIFQIKSKRSWKQITENL